MRAREELLARLAQARRNTLGAMSDAAFEELKLAVQQTPEDFIDTPQNRAFALVCAAIERLERDREDDDLRDDDEFMAARRSRQARMAADCDAALELDPACLDAKLLKLLATEDNLEVLLGRLIELEEPLAYDGDAWTDVLLRPQLRVRAAVVRACMDTARYRMAIEKALECIALAPSDALGCRHSAALAYARLEDEKGFEELDARFDHKSSAWSLLARVLLNFKLGRMGAAKRALAGYSSLVEGGAYALLRPVLIDTYMPDRPSAKPCSFNEAMLAVHEADPIIVDAPDFSAWAGDQRAITAAARAYADKHGFDW